MRRHLLRTQAIVGVGRVAAAIAIAVVIALLIHGCGGNATPGDSEASVDGEDILLFGEADLDAVDEELGAPHCNGGDDIGDTPVLNEVGVAAADGEKNQKALIPVKFGRWYPHYVKLGKVKRYSFHTRKGNIYLVKVGSRRGYGDWDTGDNPDLYLRRNHPCGPNSHWKKFDNVGLVPEVCAFRAGKTGPMHVSVFGRSGWYPYVHYRIQVVRCRWSKYTN